MRKVIDADQLVILLLAFVLLALLGLVLGVREPTGNVVLEDININENLGEKYGSLTAQHWAGLAGGEVATQEGRTAYSQYIVFKDPAAVDPIESCTVRFDRDESGVVGDVLYCKKGDDIFEYQLIFEQGLESGIEDDGQLEDIEDARIMMLGQEFLITQTEVDGNRIRLRLSGRPVEKLMAEGEKHTIVHDDKTYTVAVVSISDTTPPKVVLQVDGQTSSALDEKKAPLIGGEFPIIIHEIIPNEGREPQGKDLVNLVFGARSLDIRDDDYTDDSFTRSDVNVDGRRVIDAKLKIRATRTSDLFTISSIMYRLQAAGPEGDVFVPAGQGLAEHIRNPYGLLSSAWDLRYGGVGKGQPAQGRHPAGAATIRFDARGDGYDLEFTNSNGISYDIPLLTKRDGTLAYGDDDNDLHIREGTNASDYLIEEKEYFILTKGSEGRGSTHVLQFEGTAGGKAVFTDLSGRNKIIALFPTGAFFWLERLFNGNRIEVPLLPVTGYQALEQEGEESGEDGQALEGVDAQDAKAAAAEQFKEKCNRAKATIKLGIGNTLAGEFGLYERGGGVSMKILGAEEFPICSEFFNFMMVEGLFPLKTDAFINDCIRRAQLNDELKRCPNADELQQEVEDACRESVSELVGEINSQKEEIRRIYEEKCLPKLQEEIDAWNRARGMTTPEPSSSHLILLPDGTFVDADKRADDKQGGPKIDATGQGMSAGPAVPSVTPDSESSPEEADEEFICCEYCPSTEFIRYYIPFVGNDCEPQDARRDDLSPEQCANPLAEAMVTPEALENAPQIYGSNCPTLADIEQKDKQEKCEAAKKNYLALKAAYEALVPPVRAAWSAYQQSGYTDTSAKARYDNAYQQAHDAYFEMMIPARDEAKRLCDGVVPDAPVAPQKDAAPSSPASLPSSSDSRAYGTATDGQAGPRGSSTPPSAIPSSSTPSPAPSETPSVVPSAIPPSLAPTPSPAPEKRGTLKNERFRNELSTPLHEMNEEQLQRVSELKLGIPGAGNVQFLGDIDARGLDFDSLVIIEPNKVTVDADQAPKLNAPAIIALENIDMKEPVIYKDGKPCTTCTILSYDRDAKRLAFSTTGFSTFTAIDAAGLGRGTLTLSGSSYEFFVNAAGDAIVVDLDGDGDLDGSAIDIHVAGYGILELGAAGATADITLLTLARYTENKTSDEMTTIRVSITDGRVGIALPGFDTHEAGAWEEAMTAYGTHFALEDKTHGNDLVIDYPPAGQRSAAVSVVAKD